MFYFCRHGETDWNREGRYQGQKDIPLNDQGNCQVLSLRDLFIEKKITPTRILSSDLQRCVESVRPLSNHYSVSIETFTELREADVGQATGFGFSEIISSWGEESLRRWRSNLPEDNHFCFPDGETGYQVEQRVMSFLRSLDIVSPLEKIIVMTHSGVLRRLFRSYLGNSEIRIPNGSVISGVFRGTHLELVETWGIQL